MYSSELHGLTLVLMLTNMLDSGVTSENHTVHICTRKAIWDCNTDDVKCPKEYVVKIDKLYYKSLTWSQSACFSCSGCCEDSEWGNENTGNELDVIMNKCDDKRACVINLDVLSSSDGYWKVKIQFSCIKSITTSATSTSAAPDEQGGLTTTTTSIQILTTATEAKTTQISNVSTSAQTNQQDGFPTIVAVSVPITLIAVAVLVCVVFWYVRKRNSSARNALDMPRDYRGNSDLNQSAMDRQTHVDQNLGDDWNAYTDDVTLVSRSNAYVETSIVKESTTNSKINSSAITTDTGENIHYGNLSNKLIAVDKTYSHITNSKLEKQNFDATYSHIAGIQGLKHIDAIAGDPNDNDAMNSTFSQCFDKTNKDGTYVNTYEDDDEYNHTHFERLPDNKTGDFPVNNNNSDSEYDHTNFERTHNKNTDENDNNQRQQVSKSATTFNLDKKSRDINRDDDEYNHLDLVRLTTNVMDIEYEYGNLSNINDTGIVRNYQGDESRPEGEAEDENNTYL